MPRRTDLPNQLHRRAFAATADGAVGLSRKRLRGSDVDRPFHGVRSIGIDLTDLRGRCRAYLPRLRSVEAFSHSTAARLYGIPLPASLERETVLHVTSSDALRPRTAGVKGHRSRRALTVMFDRLPVTAPADTWCQLATVLGFEDLVAAGDALVSGKPIGRGVRDAPLCTIAELHAAIERHRPARGVRRLDAALPLIRMDVDSRRESHTRLRIVDRGLPEPVIHYAVTVASGTVLHPDLAYPELRIAIEYEGDEHRKDPRRWREDIARRRALEAAGWIVLRVTIDDLREPAGFLADLAAAVRMRSATA